MTTALPLVARPDLEGYVQAMKEDGYAYFPQVLNEKEIAELRQAMDELTALEESYDRHTDPASTMRSTARRSSPSTWTGPKSST
ncbi:MAG: hypothetical protein J4F35_17650 [Candidatus Latescibacteria bacterium]|nr:hypothetical protein [Candidatus Latescibacterota bacterium]